MNDELTILICSCDAYEDLWLPFFTLFDRYWPDCHCRIILNTETKCFNYSHLNIETFSMFNDGKVEYGKRMRKHLQQITTPYTLLLLDDFFIREPINSNELNRLIHYMNNDSQIACFNFDSINEIGNRPSDFSGYVKRGTVGHYKLNMQAGLWRTDILYSLWKDSDSPWGWEIYGSSRAFNDQYYYYCLEDISTSPVKYGKENILFGVFRGKWIKEDVLPLFSSEGIYVDFQKRGFYTGSENVATLGSSKFQLIKTAYSALSKKFFMIWLYSVVLNKICNFLKLEIRYTDYINLLQTGKNILNF